MRRMTAHATLGMAAILLIVTLATYPYMTNTVYAQQELFSQVQNETDVASLGAFSDYAIRSELAVADSAVLQASDKISVTLFGDTYIISRDSIKPAGGGAYVWSGSGDDVSDAVFVVDGTEILGLIYTVNGTFQILPVSLSVHEIYALDISLFPSLGISGVLAGDGLRAASSSSFDPGTISQLESAYFGWLEYDDSNNDLGDIVTIDVFVVITDKAISDSELDRDHSLALLAIEVANRAYASNNLPIRLHLANYDNAERYADAGSIDQDWADSNSGTGP